ncbi:hypothetical protein CsatB_006805 [Cannabis sativa]
MSFAWGVHDFSGFSSQEYSASSPVPAKGSLTCYSIFNRRLFFFHYIVIFCACLLLGVFNEFSGSTFMKNILIISVFIFSGPNKRELTYYNIF